MKKNSSNYLVPFTLEIRMRSRWPWNLILRIALAAMLLPSCATLTELLKAPVPVAVPAVQTRPQTNSKINVRIWNIDQLPPSLCEEKAASARGLFRKVGTAEEVVSFCKPEIQSYYGISQADLDLLLAKARNNHAPKPVPKKAPPAPVKPLVPKPRI